MLLDQIRQLNSSLNSLAAQFGGSRLRVFGSVARGEEGPDSDVDFLVDFPQGYDPLTQRMPLAQGLSDLLHRRVDVVPEHELNEHVRAQVLAEAVPL